MKNLFYTLTYTLLVLSITACDTSTKKQNTTAVAEELKSRKITKIPTAQILSKAQTIGNDARLTIEKAWLNRLKQALQITDIQAIDSCTLQGLKIKDSLEQKYNLTITRVSLMPINNNNKPHKISAELLDAYLYNTENNIPSSANVQKIGISELLYTYPIVFNEDNCLKCHGNASKEIVETLVQKYKIDPNAKTLNHSKGELAGMWKIVLNQKDIINHMD